MFEFFDIYLYVTIKLKRLLLMKTQLLCTFTDIQNYNEIIKQVSSFYDILFGKVYALQNRDNLDEIYLTYNINSALLDNNNFFNNTISVHRKKRLKYNIHNKFVKYANKTSK